MKTLKGKLITGAVAFGLVSAVGVGFAATDAGGKLASWYNTQFNQTEANLYLDGYAYGDAKRTEANAEVENMKGDMENQINAGRDQGINGASGAIQSKKDQYISQIQGKQSEIEANMQAQFDHVFNVANAALEFEANRAQTNAQNALSGHANSKGGEALTQVEAQINAAKNSAVGQLNAVIAAAKTELQDQLSSMSDATEAEIKDAVDAKMEAVIEYLEGKTEEFTNAQLALITAKADELQALAEAELENVANGI